MMNRYPLLLPAMLLSWSIGLAQDTAPADPPKARISGGVMAGLLETKVMPTYPAEARRNHISGTVVMHAIIGSDGTVANLNVLSGPEELREAATDAVSRWTYKPYLLNGVPTEVDTTITVNFNFGPPSPPAPLPPPTGMATGDAVSLSSGVMASRLISNPAPVYPPIARAAHVTGAVVMHVLVGVDGTVKSLQVISGPAMLQGAALSAVRQWRWQPYLQGGQPVEVDSTITINFNLGSKGASPAGGPAVIPMTPPGAGAQGHRPVTVPGDVMAALVIEKPDPVCSPEHKGDVASGTVVLDAIISAEGRVANLNVLAGPEWMRGCVLDAVSQWSYKPYAPNGVPTEVETTVTISISPAKL